ncbi:MAG: ATP-binding protein [bacterium]|nr:ATP-binding protein [bacterium]
MESRLTLHLPNQMDFLGVPDVVLMEVGGELECGRRCLEELGTAVIEACTNAMEHGNQLSDTGSIEVLIDVSPDTIRITVLDNGRGFDHVNWEPSDELMRPRGRGILIMREFTDELEFGRHDDGRFQVTLTKKLVAGSDDEES